MTASGTDLTALLHGFIITGGNASEFNDQGGGLYCKVGSPTISNCIFTRNSAESGGAVYTWKGNCWFINCRFTDNYASDSGAAIYNFDSSSLFINCILTGNRAAEKGGGMYNDLGRVQIINCSVLNNYAYAGGGVYNQKSVPVLTNCILWGNTSRYGADEPAQLYGVKVEASHCCIQGLTPELGGRNCLVKDPQITDIASGGYRIASGSPCYNDIWDGYLFL